MAAGSSPSILDSRPARLVDMAASPVDGSFVVCGETITNYDEPGVDVDAYVAKFSARGELLWNASAALASQGVGLLRSPGRPR